ncbi:unnamed protein product [Cladocopium goreaui]|uniref:Uncharacterized protein n=1 Tax=Cladocopium goreaui TaxID=2562237 RepID=A0A9P1D933_9DINO|nr:unnamed protein product [Cladocopium goreaui]
MDLHNLLHLDWFRPPLCGHLLGHQPSAESLGPGNVMRLDEGSQHSGEPFVGDEPRVRLWCRRRWSRPVAVVRTNMKQLYNVSHGEKQFTV